ncbi:hypothetical protein ASPCAL09140 [Aspergillus calidoustus]|uniref:Ubiquitin-like domain-containing protein n=1 Tax=Aspergillus calidoustus TaxID=454130 RepID=A0A0U5GTZ3_ASPCI|nr:hypothetical protein ASPCAL09140 [Aspergillus calidoustus]
MSQSGEPSSPSSLVVHVLCPSVPAPNRFTFDNLSLNTTVADLKARLSRSIQSQPAVDDQRLFYLGKPLLDDGATLQSLFGPLNGSEFSIHLVLPPSQPQTSKSTSSTASYDSLSSYQASTSIPRDNTSQYSTEQMNPRARHRPPGQLSQTDMARALQESARRRLMELNQRNGGFPHHRSWDSALWTSSRQLHRSPLHIPEPSAPGTHTTAPFVATPTSPYSASGHELQLPGEVQPRLRLLKQYISLAEEQLNCGIAPPLDHVIQLRTQLFKLLDDQLQRPLSERGEHLEPLVSRVFEISSRSDILRQRHLLTVHHGSPRAAAPMYLLSSPNGYQAVVASPTAADTSRHYSWARGTTPSASNAPMPDAQQPHAEAAVMENVVRQAVLNQRPAVADGQLGLGRNLRRLWLFVRLYFFCFMFSPAGTWTRIIYVALAVVASILSETSVPRRVYELILAPVQRHLEGLVHFAPEEPLPPRAQGTEGTGDDATTNQMGIRNDHDANWTAGLHHSLRRVERSAALFIASLVPGVGERHIEVRNAAEAARNAELARQEEERRRQEEEAASAATGEQETEDQPQAGDAAVSDWSTRASTGSPTPTERQPSIPQEASP